MSCIKEIAGAYCVIHLIGKGEVLLNNVNYGREVLFEHRFWLQILGDHGRFIYNTLSPSEEHLKDKAAYFIRVFDDLLDESRRLTDESAINKLTKISLLHANDIRRFKLEIIKEQISDNIIIELPPTFINHMVNEVEEYLRILRCAIKMEDFSEHPLHYHNLWLPDAAGHAGAVYCGLDSVEKDIRRKSREFAEEFEDLHMKAYEFSGYLRTELKVFPALQRLNSQAELKINMFMRFLREIEMLRNNTNAVGTLMPLMADHMYREECYYLVNLSGTAKITMPECNPAKPRI